VGVSKIYNYKMDLIGKVMALKPTGKMDFL
jgi:hypothetical protein